MTRNSPRISRQPRFLRKAKSLKFFILILMVTALSIPAMAGFGNECDHVCSHYNHQHHCDRWEWICPTPTPTPTPIPTPVSVQEIASFYNPFHNDYISCQESMNLPADKTFKEGDSYKAIFIVPIGLTDGVVTCNYNELDTLFNPLTHERLYFNNEIEENRVASSGITVVDINTPSRQFTVQASVAYTSTPSIKFYGLIDTTTNKIVDFQAFIEQSIIHSYALTEEA